MGDAILKNSIYLLFLLMGCLTATQANSTQSGNYTNEKTDKYDVLFNEINEVRIGIAESDVALLSNPFVAPPVARVDGGINKTALTPLSLNAIIEGKKVMINNSWYDLNSLVRGMRISSIKSDSVTLRGTNKTMELYLRKKNENSIIKSN